MAEGVWQRSARLIINRRKSGYTLEEIGNELGVTRERIRQLLKDYSSELLHPEGIYTTHQLSKLTHRRRETIIKLLVQAGIKPLRKSKRKTSWSKEALEFLCQFNIKGAPQKIKRSD